MMLKISELESVRIANLKMLQPLEPYKSAKGKWKCKCLKCGEISTPTLDSIKRKEFGCKFCNINEANKKRGILKRLSVNEVKDKLESLQLTLLSEYESEKKIIRLSCNICNSVFTAKFKNLKIRTNYQCPNCKLIAYKPKLINNKVDGWKEGLEKFNVIPVGEYINSGTKIEFLCQLCNSTFMATRLGITSGRTACKCVRKQMKSNKKNEKLERLKIYAIKKGGLCLSTEYIIDDEPLTWQCALNHTWKQKASVVVRANTWCPDCGKKARITIDQLIEYINKKNGKLESNADEFKNGKSKVTVRCSSDHVWKTSVTSLLHQETWCPKCAGHFPRTLEELILVVEKRKGKLLSTKYINVEAKYDFECMLGHKFSNSFKKVVNTGQWRPHCNRGHLSEEIARTTFEQIFNLKFPKSKPVWLRNQKGFQLEFDGFCEELSIAFEYHGIQHFEPRSHNYKTDLKILDKEKSFAHRKQNDKIKLQLAKSRNVQVFELTYKDTYEDFPRRIYEQAINFGIDISSYDFNKVIDFTAAYLRVDRIVEFRELLQNKNIQLLSDVWLGVSRKYDLFCLTCGHKWKAQGNAFFNSRSIAGCKKCAMKKLALEHSLTTQDLIDYAKTFGGQLISKKYLGRQSKYDWLCKNNHHFTRNFNTMSWYKNFCPECDGLQIRLTPADRERQLLERGFRPVADFPGSKNKWKVNCLKCGSDLEVIVHNIETRKLTCEFCKKREMAKTASDLMKKLNLEPLEDFPGRYVPWKSKCLICQAIVSPTLVNLQRHQGGCKFCARTRRKMKNN